MISRVVGDVLHQLTQLDVDRPKRKEFLQASVGCAVDKLDLLHLDFDPLRLHRLDRWICFRRKQEVASVLQICDKFDAQRLCLPILKPDPLSSNNVDQRVPHGPETSAKVACELLGTKLCSG